MSMVHWIMEIIHICVSTILVVLVVPLMVQGHYYSHPYFTQETTYQHNVVGGNFQYEIPSWSPYHHHHHNPYSIPSFPSFPFQHINWIGNPDSSSELIPNELKPSIVGWDTIYNVPCGSYTIHPFVIANVRYQSGGGGGSKKHYIPTGRETRSYRSPKSLFHMDFPKSCSWEFKAFGSCKLKFFCSWFQLPALFKCEENYIELTDTEKVSYRFCGNRKPRGPYVSTSQMIKLTYKSESSLLPTIFDCAVSCSLEALKFGSSNNETKGGTDMLTVLGKPKTVNQTQPEINNIRLKNDSNKKG